MEDNEDSNYFRYIENEVYHGEKNTEYDSNRNEEPKFVYTHINNSNILALENNKNFNDNINNFNSINSEHNDKIPFNCYIENLTEGNKYVVDNNLNKNYNYNNQIYEDRFLDNEQTQNKITLTTYNARNGIQINIRNDTVSRALNQIVKTDDVDIEKKSDMQLLRKKKKRRTKLEIEKEKKNTDKEQKPKNKKGRKKQEDTTNENNNNDCQRHSKISDDNIMKKINSNFWDYILDWLNNSFLDESGQMESEIKRKKLKKKLFLKLDPAIITTNLKKSSMTEYLNMKLKDILSNKISKKYTKKNTDENKQLIEQIYEENYQKYVIFILELKFTDILNFFNGQDNGENFKQSLMNQNLDITTIEMFLQSFKKVDILLKKIKDKLDHNKEKEENSKDYLQRISILCLNYQTWFNKKFHRSTKKKL